MYCKTCGKEINDDAVVCPACGCAVKTEETKKPAKKLNVLGLIGFILGLVSWLISLWGIVAIAGLVLSIVGLVQCVKDGGGMKGFPIAGIAVSAVSLVYTVYVLIVAAAIIAAY